MIIITGHDHDNHHHHGHDHDHHHHHGHGHDHHHHHGHAHDHHQYPALGKWLWNLEASVQTGSRSLETNFFRAYDAKLDNKGTNSNRNYTKFRVFFYEISKQIFL